MKPIKVLVVLLSIFLLGAGCSQDILNQILQKDSEEQRLIMKPWGCSWHISVTIA